MSEIKNTIEPSDVEWKMTWDQTRHPDKPPVEMVFEEGPALAHLLINDVCFLNSLWWEKECPERVQNLIACAVNCNDMFVWGCADAEPLPYGEIGDLYKLWRDRGYAGVCKWVCRRRNEQPQDPIRDSLKKSGDWDAEFDALPPNAYWTSLRTRQPPTAGDKP